METPKQGFLPLIVEKLDTIIARLDKLEHDEAVWRKRVDARVRESGSADTEGK